MALWVFLCASLLLQPGRGFQAGITFTGGLERVGDQSISVKLADRKVIDAMLPDTQTLNPEALVAQYKMGDQVEIQCKPIQSVWEAATSRFQSLEVTAIRLVRRPPPEEVSRLLEARAREGKNLLERPALAASTTNRATDPNAAGSKEWEEARRINQKYLAHMPNFVADETAKRYRSTARLPERHFDTVESEITFRGRRAVRQQIRRDGKPWSRPSMHFRASMAERMSLKYFTRGSPITRIIFVERGTPQVDRRWPHCGSVVELCDAAGKMVAAEKSDAESTGQPDDRPQTQPPTLAEPDTVQPKGE